jgi:hypothetical protein
MGYVKWPIEMLNIRFPSISTHFRGLAKGAGASMQQGCNMGGSKLRSELGGLAHIFVKNLAGG